MRTILARFSCARSSHAWRRRRVLLHSTASVAQIPPHQGTFFGLVIRYSCSICVDKEEPMKYVSRIVLIFALSPGLAATPVLAQSQAITTAELRDAVKQAAADRQKNLEQVRSFFADPKVSKALKQGHIDSGRLQKAISALDAGELAKLASRTTQIQNDFAAGALDNQELTYIVIALAAAVLVLIVVAA